jgi:LysR family transcriptional regulator, glycine cleavage system transcriptional activator
MGAQMPERLPPLNALKAFEAAARHASFRKAAGELHVSPAAISHQIKNLEEHLGIALFDRGNRALTLTAAGTAALPLLQEGFARLAAAVQQLRGAGRPAALRLCAPPSFAAKWLLPRVSRYAADHPGLDIRLSASFDMIGEHAEAEPDKGGPGQPGIDLAVRFGDGDHPGCRVDKLMSVAALPLCSPRLLAGEHALRKPADLRHHVLLHDDTDYPERPDWRAWLAAAGVDDIDAARGLRFNQAALALEAAVEGQGVALSLEPLARADLAAGRLVAPFDVSLALRSAYYLVSAETAAEVPANAAFRQWLLAQAAAESAAA